MGSSDTISLIHGQAKPLKEKRLENQHYLYKTNQVFLTDFLILFVVVMSTYSLIFKKEFKQRMR